jgi:hypothetical protein
MGNQLAQPTKLQPEHLAELDDVVLKTMLGKPTRPACTTTCELSFAYDLL